MKDFIGIGVRAALWMSASSLIVFSSPARAQESEPSAGRSDAIAEVIVTARRMEEDLQRVPVKVTAVTPEMIERNAVTDVTSLQKIVPGYQGGARFPNNGLAASINRIRGLQGIANYFNDVPSGIASHGPFFDVQNIQVLMGPQGTLFGEASNAGAIVMTPRKPGNEYGGYLSVAGGNDQHREIEGAMDLPLVSEKVLMRLAGKSSFTQGYLEDIFSGHRLGEENYTIGRAILVLRPWESFEIETVFGIEKSRSVGSAPFVIHDFNMFATNTLANTQATVNGMTRAQFNAARDYTLWLQQQIGPYRIQGWSLGCPATATTPVTKSKVPGPNIEAVTPNPCPPSQGWSAPRILVNTVTWDFAENFTLRQIFGTTWSTDLGGLANSDNTRLIFRDTNPRSVVKTSSTPWDGLGNWTGELQLVGNVWDNRIHFVNGVYHRGNRTEDPQITFAQFSTNLNDTASLNSTDSRTWAAYAQADVNLTDKLIATVGVRRTRDRTVITRYTLNQTTLDITGVTGGPGVPSTDGKWWATSYTTGLRYQLTDDTMFYFNHSKGHGAGGLQNVTGFERFEPDSLKNYEVGIKSTFQATDDWRMRVDTSVYYGIFSNIQVSGLALVNIPGTSGSGFLNLTQNAGEAEIKGATLDLTAAYRDRFSARFVYGYADNKYTKYDGVNPVTLQPVDLSATPFPNTPKWKYTLSATYNLPTIQRVGDLSFGADFTSTPETWGNIAKPIVPTTPGDPNSGAICKLERTVANGYGPLSADGGTAYKDCAPPYRNLNLRIDWRNPMGHENVRASLRVTNVTAFDGPTGIGTSYDSTGFTTFYTAQPRYFVASLRYDF